ncbi:MAG: AMP-binding protein, partial [Oscillospiraceae bacterium]|nr:AMP-binding protein [Oscillospiraceae bacterium]
CDTYKPTAYNCFTEKELLDRLEAYSEKMPPDCLAVPCRAQTTGGSTGKPKLIKIKRPAGESDESLMSWFHMTGQFFGCRQLVCGPMFHSAPCSAAFSGLNCGNLVVMPNNFKPIAIERYIKEYGIECVQMVPTLMHRMLKLDSFNKDDFKTLRALCHTGGYCSPELKEAWIEILGAKNVYEIYSMTEMIGMTVIRGDEWLKHRGSVGKPYGGCKIEVRDENGKALPAGEVGEIFMTPSGGYLETEYVGREQLDDSGKGFRSVGDMGYLDEDGYMYFADRRSDMIVTGGENVLAVEVENTFLQHPDIVDMVVVGIPDPEWGRRIHAVIEAKREMSYDEFRRYGWKFMLPFKVPKTIEYVDALPRKDSGKLNRAALAARCEELQKDIKNPFGLYDTGLREILRKEAEEANKK